MFYIGVQSNGLFYQRFVYGFLDLISKAGGFLGGLNRIILPIVSIICSVSANSKLIHLILNR